MQTPQAFRTMITVLRAWRVTVAISWQ
jgi:hypothetical protein